MRFCPFCRAENTDDLAVCQSCGRRLPPLPPRRARDAPPTGVQLPPRSASTTQPPPSPRTTQPFGGQRASVPELPAQPPRGDSTVAQPDADRRALLSAINPGPAAQRREAPPAERDPVFTRRSGEAPGVIPSIPLIPAGTLPPAVPGRPTAPASLGPPPPQAPPSSPPPRPHSPSSPPPMPRPKPPSLPPPGPHSAPLAATPLPPVVPATPAYPVIPRAAFDDDFNTAQSADPVHIAAHRVRSPTGVEPPPTRIQRSDALVDRPFTPPAVSPVPEIPEPGLVHAAKYAVRFGRARWQRRGAIRTLGDEIKQDTEALDHVLGALGREARNAKVESRVLSAENAAISAAEERVGSLGKEHGDVDARKVDENAKFVDVELERNTKLGEAERLVDEAQKELAQLEGQRRGLRDKRKDHERRQKAYLRSAEDKDREAGAQQLGDARQEVRRSAESFRKEAASLEPERQEMERKLAALERPINEATARLDAAKAELDAAKRSLADAREGHTHRLAELDAEQKRKSREIGLAEGEIQRRLVTLGTLVNLNRIEAAGFTELYQRIDRIRGAITARTTEIEKLTAEREAYDHGTLVRGVSTIGGAILLFIALLVILRACVT
ncbi:MAG: hypothetical protein ABI867_39090 [Kofleriaceae bacterium]